MRLELRPREDIHAGCDDDPAPVAILFPVGVSDEDPLGDLHPEDAFLVELRAFLRRSYRLGAGEHACVDEIARDALDLVEGPEGDFARLPVTRWLDAAAAAGVRQRVATETALGLALAFVTFLRVEKHVDMAAARRLRRAIVARRAQALSLPCAA